MAAIPKQRGSWGPRNVRHVLQEHADRSWEHAERMQGQGYPYDPNSNITTMRYATPAPTTIPFERPTPQLMLPDIPRVDIVSDDFYWTCDLDGCDNGWPRGPRPGPFWAPKYVKLYAAGNLLVAEVRHACCSAHAQQLKKRLIQERMGY